MLSILNLRHSISDWSRGISYLFLLERDGLSQSRNTFPCFVKSPWPEVYEHSFQKAPKFPPPTKPPKTSVLGMANVPMVSVKKQAPNEQKGQRSTPKVEVSKESSNQGHGGHGNGFGWIWRFELLGLGCWGRWPGDPNLDPGRRASSAKAWLDGSELPTAPVEGKVPVPKFLMWCRTDDGVREGTIFWRP